MPSSQCKGSKSTSGRCSQNPWRCEDICLNVFYKYFNSAHFWNPFSFVLNRYLRKYPYKEDGQHIQSFLCKENWEEYLERMSRTKEWGDHIILQALVDAFNLNITIFNVFEDDVRHTILQTKAGKKHKHMQAFLGHIGEFHYLSLRPGGWTKLWPYSK